MTKNKDRLLGVFDRRAILFTYLCFFILSTSCITQRKLEYFQDTNTDSKTFSEAGYADYRLKPNDELYIQINSLDEASASIFSSSRDQVYSLGTIQPYGASLLSYSVDKDGNLLLPVIGSVLVYNKTLSEVSSILKEAFSHILNQPVVTVKLVNRYVSVLGEVKTPGHFVYSQEKMSIYDAIALAGDITVFGNRKNVILIRNENGNNTRVNINLNDSNILTSAYYHLRPNDILYVKPLKQRFWGVDQLPYTTIFSAITTAILIYTVVK